MSIVLLYTLLGVFLYLVMVGVTYFTIQRYFPRNFITFVEYSYMYRKVLIPSETNTKDGEDTSPLWSAIWPILYFITIWYITWLMLKYLVTLPVRVVRTFLLDTPKEENTNEIN